MAAAAAALIAGPAEAGPRSVTIRGSEMNRFGRIALEFDQPTKVKVRAANGVLVLTFPEATKVQGERLTRELPAYLTQVRHDPDGRGLRVALARPWRTNVLEAAEKVFIDLLPSDWVGLLPALPPEVVDALARRAREAEARAGDEARRRQAESVRLLPLRVARLPTLTRFVLEEVGGIPVSLVGSGPEAEIRVEALATVELGAARTQVGSAVRSIEAETAGNALRIKLGLKEGHEARGFREDNSFVVDIVKPRQVAVLPDLPEPSPEPPAPAPAEAEREPAPAPAPAPEPPARQAEASPTPRPAPAPDRSGAVRAKASLSGDGLAIEFPFRSRTAAAAFERGGAVTVVFQTSDTIDLPPLPPAAAAYAATRANLRQGGFAVLRFALRGPYLTRLAPEGEGWLLSIGETGRVASEPVTPQRAVDDIGRAVLHWPLPGAAGVHWLADGEGGERIAVATAFGPPRAVAKPHRFVEFHLLPTAHGLALVPDADDVVVRADLEGVTVSRELGLALTVDGAAEAASAAALDPVVQRDRWAADQLGSVRERQRELTGAIVQAPRSGRSGARIELARLLLANRLDFEASGVLSVAAAEDPSLLRQRHFLLLQGIALLRMGRGAEARRVLATDIVAEDPEAVLWRALLDARAKRWTAALAGFRRSKALIDLYPEDLQAAFHLAAARAAIESKEWGYAERALAAAGEQSREAGVSDEIALLKARIDEGTGREDVAEESYRKLAESAERPIAAEAALRWPALALARRSMEPEEAVARLETASVAWRGDEVEIGALGQLGRFYAQSGRWRDAFTVARRASRIFPDHDTSRALHDETGRLFEDLFLSGKSESLSRVDALALYFDFKEFTPIGRRGDEIVRRLADRLVELDLLEHAGDLLQHQVENRLSGVARATVAARLATVRLMDGKPQRALQAIQATRLPELPATIKRARILLEARALSDLSRTDLALEVIAAESGPEIERLRADILWTGRRWREAGEQHERLAGLRWQGAEPLDDRERLDLLRAGIAYALAEEGLALDRLRARFSAKMADSKDARIFAFLTQPRVASTHAFRDIARGVTSADTLSEFLAEYRKRYPEAAVAERRRQPAAPSEAAPLGKPQAQAPATAAKG